jgi:hypothetical protein
VAHCCENFFRAQRTDEVAKVELASFHMTGAAQHWYYMRYMLECNVGIVQHFKALCQQRAWRVNVTRPRCSRPA